FPRMSIAFEVPGPRILFALCGSVRRGDGPHRHRGALCLRRPALLDRPTFHALLVAAALVVSATAALADEHPTAEQLYQQGMMQYQEGSLEAARATLRKVDPAQLTKEERVTYADTLKALDKAAAPQPASDPASLLKAAQAAHNSGQLAKATGLYRDVIA